MKKIVCYGDSNTFGFNPKDGSRFGENTRWTALLQKKSGDKYKIINEGMCDRTGFVNNPKGFLFSAPKHFPEFIEKTDTIDLLILWIGTNDLQFLYDISTADIEKGLENLIKLAKTKAEKIVIIPPVMLSEKILEGYFRCQFDEISIKKSTEIQNIYKTLADSLDCEFFDINKIVKPSNTDGLHFDEVSHKIIAEKLYDFILNHIFL